MRAVRRFLHRGRRGRPRPPSVAGAIYNLLTGTRGALATVAYSDRYFRYGLPLRARWPGAADWPAHFVPLSPRPGPAPRGLLLGVPRPRALPRPRYAPMRRARRDLPRVFLVDGAGAAGRETDGYPARALPLDCRQSRRGVSPATVPRAEVGGAFGRRRRSLSLRSRASLESALRPQFAREDAAEDERVYEEAPSKRPERYDAANLAEASAAAERHDTTRLERKVLNTERYNNGARAPLLRRRAGGAQAARRVSAANARAAGPRAAIRFLLGLNALLYSLALLAFYFLSLAG